MNVLQKSENDFIKDLFKAELTDTGVLSRCVGVLLQVQCPCSTRLNRLSAVSYVFIEIVSLLWFPDCDMRCRSVMPPTEVQFNLLICSNTSVTFVFSFSHICHLCLFFLPHLSPLSFLSPKSVTFVFSFSHICHLCLFFLPYLSPLSFLSPTSVTFVFSFSHICHLCLFFLPNLSPLSFLSPTSVTFVFSFSQICHLCLFFLPHLSPLSFLSPISVTFVFCFPVTSLSLCYKLKQMVEKQTPG